VHNNAGAQTGTETWYDDTNGLEGDSARLAQAINAHVVSAIRQRYNANWIDRGLRVCNGCKGENRLATRPSIIVEIAYMDTAAPDNDALHDDAFKRIVAEAIGAGVREWASAADDGRR
jgi:N-acetylmuramoyl-L-alanine amidase